VRLSYTKNGLGTEVIEESNYYPFGLKHQGYNQPQGNPSYKYQYNDKEIQEETGWIDFGARMYMADIGRWGVIDPLSETSTRFTPYNYAYNNPISFIDPDSRKAIAPRGVDPIQSMDGAWGYALGGGRIKSNNGSGNNNESTTPSGFWLNNMFIPLPEILIPTVYITAGDPDWGMKMIDHFNSYMAKWNAQNNDYWGILNNASTTQSFATNGIGATLGTAAQMSNDLVNQGKMIKVSNFLKTYNLYRVNGALNGNKYISGAKFMRNVKTINALNNSKVVKGVARLGLVISGAQFLESHHPGYISRGIVSYAAGYIPYVGSVVSLGIDNTNVDYWNIWTMVDAVKGEHNYDYLDR